MVCCMLAAHPVRRIRTHSRSRFWNPEHRPSQLKFITSRTPFDASETSGFHDLRVKCAGWQADEPAISWWAMISREQALEILHEFTKSEGLRKHALAVEACVAS